MPRHCYQEPLRYLYFVYNGSINAQDKLDQIRPLISMVQEEFVKKELEEYNLVDEQIIPLKKKYLSIRQYNAKKLKKRGFKNLVPAGMSGFMHDFFVYDGKTFSQLDDGKFGHLQKCAQVVVTTLCDYLPGYKDYKVFFGNWFTTLDILNHFASKGKHAIGTLQSNRLQCCPLDANKALIKNGRGAIDYRCDGNSGIMAVKWVDNSVVNLASTFVGDEPITELERWC